MVWLSDEKLAGFMERRPHSPAAAELGREFLAIDPEAQAVRLSFEPTADHCNPMGGVQGGMLIAMLDETMTEAIVLATKGEFYIPTLSIEARFLLPAKREKLFAVGRVLRLGRRTAFLDAELYDSQQENLLVSGRATVTMASWESIRAKVGT